MPGELPVSDGLVAVVVAASCVLAVGMGTTTLESSVKTNPDDVIDLPRDVVPFGTGTLQTIKRQAAGAETGSNSDRTGNGSPTSEPGTGEAEAASQTDSDRRTVDQAPDDGSNTGAAIGPRDRSGGSGQTNAEEQPPLRDRLAGVFWLVVVLAVVGTIVYALRRRLAAFFEGGTTGEASTPASPPTPTPTDGMALAWYRMIEGLGLDWRPTAAPGEYADAAVRDGADRDGVTTLTDLFRECRYGGAPVTEDRLRRARDALSRLGIEDDDEDDDGSGAGSTPIDDRVTGTEDIETDAGGDRS
jgi:hypothetical protein